MSEFMRVELGIKKELHHLEPLVMNYWTPGPASVKDLMYISFVQSVPVTQRFTQQLFGRDLLVHLFLHRLHQLQWDYLEQPHLT